MNTFKEILSNEHAYEEIINKLNFLEISKFCTGQTVNAKILDRPNFESFISEYFTEPKFMDMLKKTKAVISGNTIVQYILGEKFEKSELSIYFECYKDLATFCLYLIKSNGYTQVDLMALAETDPYMIEYSPLKDINLGYIDEDANGEQSSHEKTWTFTRCTKSDYVIEMVVPGFKIHKFVNNFYASHLKNFFDCATESLWSYSIEDILEKKSKFDSYEFNYNVITKLHPDLNADNKEILENLSIILNELSCYPVKSADQILLDSSPITVIMVNLSSRSHDKDHIIIKTKQDVIKMIIALKVLTKYQKRGFVFTQGYESERLEPKIFTLINVTNNQEINKKFYEHTSTESNQIAKALKDYNIDWDLFEKANAEISGSFVLAKLLDTEFDNMDLDIYIQEEIIDQDFDAIDQMLHKNKFTKIENVNSRELKYTEFYETYPDVYIWSYYNESTNQKIDIISYSFPNLSTYILNHYYADHIMNFYNIYSKKAYSCSPLEKLNKKEMSLSDTITTDQTTFLQICKQNFDKYTSKCLKDLYEILPNKYGIGKKIEKWKGRDFMNEVIKRMYDEITVLSSPKRDRMYNDKTAIFNTHKKDLLATPELNTFLETLYQINILYELDEHMLHSFFRLMIPDELDHLCYKPIIGASEKYIKYIKFVIVFKKFIAIKKYMERGFVLV